MLSRANFTVCVLILLRVLILLCMCPHTPGWPGGQNAVARQLCGAFR